MSDYPKDWEDVKLSNILIPQQFHDYLCKKTSNIGKYPIIQQGDEPIYGYAESKPYEEYKRVLLFGDHTLSLYRPTKPFLLSSDGVKILKCSDELNRDYVFYLMKNYMPESEGYKRHYTVIKNLELMITQKKQEQKAIADTLMTFDKHIKNLEKLIEKKKMIRDGAVEDLMTGKTRLDGFDGEWEEVKLGEIANITKLAGFEFTKYVSYSENGKIIALRGLNIKNGKLDLTDVKYIDNSNFSFLDRSKLFKGDIVFTYVGTVGEAAVINENKYYLAPNVARIRLENKINSKFIAFIISSKSFYKKVIFPLIATSSQPALSMGNIRKFSLYITSNIKEQEAIVSIITSMDEEIENLENEKAKIEKIKAGAMDDLLTGKVRLI